jgi:Flp pilus assembly protein TadG
MGILNWLKNPPRAQRALRHPSPGIVAYYWDGGTPREHQVKDLSLTGAYLYGTGPWVCGTLLALTIKGVHSPAPPASVDQVLCLRGKIVRLEPDGMGIRFVLLTPDERKAWEQFMSKLIVTTEKAPPAGTQRAAEQGQSLVEYAFMLPFLFLLLVNCVNFGVFIYDWIEVANAARAGAQYAILSGASAGSLTAATGTQITALIKADMVSLPATPTISICTNNNGTLTTLAGTCSTTTTPADPEAPLYVLATVDVSYAYTPMTGALSFPKLGIHATIPPTTIHRQAVMRMIQ